MRLHRIALLVVCAVLMAATPILAATDVRCMPDRQVLDGSTLPVFGAACTGVGCVPGDGSAIGETYLWSFSTVNVTVADDGDLSDGGPGVGDDHYVKEDVTLTLGAGTREIITATLDVGGTQCSVNIDVVSPADALYATPDDALLVDVNIAIEDGLRFLYLNQEANGSWPGASAITAYRVTSTGLAVWAFNNSGHAPANGTIYSPSSQAGLDYIFGTTSTAVNLGGHPGSNFNTHLPGEPASELGINPTGPIGSADEDYSGGFALGAVLSTVAPATVITVGPAAGLTYAQYVEEFTDWAAYGQRDNNCPANGCGGWVYQSSSWQFGGDDLSINSWMYIALEGAETVFGSSFNPRMKDLIDTSLVNRQEDTLADPDFGRFGYYGMTPVRGTIGYATSCAGLSGLALEELPGNKSAGTPDYTVGAAGVTPAHLDTFAEKEAAVLAHLGRNWARNPIGAAWLQGNHGNHYAMWTCCRGLRIAGIQNLNNDGTFGGAVGPFDWEKNIAGGGDTVTGGYWPFLVNTQQADGRWQTNLSQYNNIFDTAIAVLCLQPTVFGFCGDGVVTAPEECDPPGPTCSDDCVIVEPQCPEDPDPRTQGYWHRQCLGMSASDPDCPGIDPGRNGRGPQSPNNPDFCPTYHDCAELKLEDLGFFGLGTCEGLDADPPSDKCEKATKQLTALILNVCSGLLEDGCEVDVAAEGCSSTNVGELIDELTGLIMGGDCQTANACAAQVNEGLALVGGGSPDEFGVSPSDTRGVQPSKGTRGSRR